MADKKGGEHAENTRKIAGGTILPRDISQEMRESYLDYAMSVITSRALPDVRDGLKPVHRRILYAMHDMGLTHAARFRKSAAVVGDVLGKYHPHGDMAVYDALVKMAQDFSFRYPLILGQGNFGSIDGDSQAAMRYTECKMSSVSGEMLRDLEKETVEWRPNYDGTRNEPIVLPAAVPNLLLNGTLGIAVGMATNIPPHNLGELIAATTHLIDNRDATTEDLLKFVQGPDFPTGGVAFNAKDIAHAYASGRGGVVVRGEAEVVEGKSGHTSIVIASLPYRVNKADLVSKIAELVRDKKVEGIKALRDESARGETRVVVDLKQGTQPQKILNYLYKHTALEETFHYNMLALVEGIPQTLSLKIVLEEFLKHRENVVTLRTKYELRVAEERAHILEGLKNALDNIDKVIKVIRASKDTPSAHANLRGEFRFSDRQATAILEMKLQKLAGLERKQIENELREKLELIKELKAILGSKAKIFAIVKKELIEVGKKYGDERRTKISKRGVTAFSEEDFVPEGETVVVLSQRGFLKRTDPSEYRRQKRGGVGVMDLNTNEEDFVTMLMTGNTHDSVLFFSDKGRAYQTKMYEIPEGRRATKGKSIMNFLPLSEGERITSVVIVPKDTSAMKGSSLVMVTVSGIIKKVAAGNFFDVRRSGIIAIKLKGSDSLLASFFAGDKDDIMLVTGKGQAIRFKSGAVRAMGRGASGVRAMRLKKGDAIVGAARVSKDVGDLALLTMSEQGYGKKTSLKEYKTQGRGGSGIKTAKVTPKTGPLMVGRIVSPDDEELIAISRQSQIIRLGLKEVPMLGRQTQGVRIMKLREKDSVAAFICL